MFLWQRCVAGDKGRGHCGLSTGKREQRQRQSRIFRGSFIHLSLSSYDKGQALTKAEVGSGSVTSSWPVRPSQPLVWRLPTVYQPAEHLSTEWGGVTPNTEKLLIQWELGWLHRIVTYKRVMSLVSMYVNQEKRNKRPSGFIHWIWITYNNLGQDISVSSSFVFLPQNHQPPARSCMWK